MSCTSKYSEMSRKQSLILIMSNVYQSLHYALADFTCAFVTRYACLLKHRCVKKRFAEMRKTFLFPVYLQAIDLTLLQVLWRTFHPNLLIRSFVRFFFCCCHSWSSLFKWQKNKVKQKKKNVNRQLIDKILFDSITSLN